MFFNKKDFFSFICCSFFLSNAYADEPVTLSALKTVVTEFAAKNMTVNADETLDVQIKALNTALQMPACATPLQTALPAGASANLISAVAVSCSGPQAWHILVPVTIAIKTNVLVAKRMIPARQAVTAEDVTVAQYDRNMLYAGYFKTQDQVIGLTTAQVISAGSVFNKNSFKAQVLVHRGQLVDIIARNQAIQVTMKGIAKADGSLNDVIQVYNPSSKKLLDATVVATSKVEVLA